MKKLLTILILLLAVVTQGWADISLGVNTVWTGSEKISWNTEVVEGTQFESTDGTFTGLLVGDKIVVTSTLTEGYSSDPQYVLTYKAGDSWEWTDLTTSIESGTINYTVASEQIATEIAQRGLVFRGQGYTITKIEVIRGYKITITSPTNGTITVKNGDTDITTGDYVPENTSLTLTAAGTTGYVFDKWTSPTSLSSESASANLSVTEDVTIAADFKSAKTLQTLSTGSKWIVENGGVTIGKANFANVAAGDLLKVAISDIADGATYTLKSAGDGEETTNWSTLGNVTTGVGVFTYAFTAEDITKIQASGLFITGNGYTCGNIQIETAATISSEAIHSDPTLTFTQPEHGTITVKVGENSVESGAKIGEKKTLSLKAEPDAGYEFVSWTSPSSLAEANAETTIEMASSDMTISAQFMAVNEGETEPDASTVDATEIFSTETALGNWDIATVTMEASMFTKAIAGDYIKVTLTPASTSSQINLQTMDNSWSSLTGLTTVTTGKTATKYIYKITADALTQLKATGLAIKGKDCTINKVELLTAKPNKTLQTLSTGSKTIVENGGVSVAGSLLSDVAVGDVLTVTVSDVEVSAKYQLKYAGGNWDTFLEATDLGTEATSFTYTIADANVLSNIQTNGIFITGNGYTCGDIKIETAATINSDATHSNPTLTITAPEHGTVTVKNGENVVVTETKISAGTALTLKAEPAEGYKFSKWTSPESLASSPAETTTVMTDGNMTITAEFEALPETVEALAAGETRTLFENATGVAMSWNEICEKGAAWGEILEEGEKFRITISSKTNADWPKVTVRDGSSTDKMEKLVNDITEFPYVAELTLSAENVSALANGFRVSGDGVTITKVELYKPNKYTLTLSTPENGAVVIKKGETEVEAGQFEENTELTLTATASEGYSFTKWTIGEEEATENPLTLTMTANKTVSATFTVNTPEKTGVDISLTELNEGWNSTYDAATKTITTTGEWAARGWYVGDDRYNGKGSITVKFNAVDFPVTLKMEYTNTANESKDSQAGAAAGETEVELDIPTDVKTIDKVYITYQPAGTLALTEATVNDKVVDNRTEKTLVENTQAIADGDVRINRGLFSNAVAGDIIRIYGTPGEGAKIALEPADYSGALDGASWTTFEESPFALKLTETVLNTIKEKDLLVRGENYTFNKAVLYTENELGEAIADATKYTLNLTSPENGTVTIKQGGETVEPGEFEENTELTLTATASEGYSFTKWTIGEEEATENPLTLTMTADKTVSATFTANTPEKTGVDISLAEMNEGWSSTYDAATKTITTTGEWAARGWYVGDDRYNGKGSITVKFNAVEFPVTLKMEYTNTNDEGRSVEAGAAAGETEVVLDIPDNVKTIDKVYITYQPAGTLALTEATVNDKVVDNRTEKTLVENTQAIADGDVRINRGLFSNAVAGDIIRIYGTPGEEAKIALEPADYSGAFDAANWTTFEESPFALKLTETVLNTIKEKGLLVRGENYTFTKAVLYTETALGNEIEDEEPEPEPQEPDEPTKTGIDISLGGMNEGWSSTYDASTKTITTEGEWGARGWYIGDDRYNGKGSITVKFNAVDFPVTLKMEYTNANDEGKSAEAGAAAGETEVVLDIPDNVKTIDKVYITYQPAGTLALTEATVNDKVVDNRTEKTLVERSQAIADGDITINRGLFSNAVAGDIIRIYGTPGEGAKIALEPADYSGALDGASWTAFGESPFALKLTETVLNTIKEKDLLVRGENYTFNKAVLYTENELGKAIADATKYTLNLTSPENGKVTIKQGGETVEPGEFEENTELTLTAEAAEGYLFTKWIMNGEDAGREATLAVKMTANVTITAVFDQKPVTIIDEETGEADLSKMTAQDAEATTVTVNTDDHSITITTTEPYKAAQIWFNEPEEVRGNVLVVNIAEQDANVTVTVKYTDGTESAMTSTTAGAPRSAAHRASTAGTQIIVPVDMGKKLQCIELKNALAGTLHVTKMVFTTQNVFTDGKANLSMAKAQSNATYDIATYTLATTKGWTGLTLTPLESEDVKGVELMVKFHDDAQVKLQVVYVDGTELSTIMDKSGRYVKMTLDKSKDIREVTIQPTTAGVIQLTELSVNQTPTPDEIPAPVFTNGKADLSRLTVQDASRVMYNTETCKMATTDGWVGVELNTTEAEYVSGAELAVRLTEAVKVKVAVVYNDGSHTDTIPEKATEETRLLLDPTKSIQQIQIQPTEAGALQFVEIVVRQTVTPEPEPVYFFNKEGVADLSQFLPMGSNATYDETTHQLTTTEDWAGIQAWLENPQAVDGNVLSVKLAEENANVKISIGYTDGTESTADGADTNATETGTEILVPNDATKEIQKVMIQMPEAGTVTLLSISSINFSVTELTEGENRLLWKNSQGAKLSWNNICKKDALYGAILKEGQQLLVTVSNRDENNEWPKIFVRDASDQETGQVVELNSLRHYPYVVRITLTDEMVNQMADGFAICGDGVTVTSVYLYQPLPPQPGDINLIELNGGWNSTYDTERHIITTTSRWGACGWNIGDDRYNGMNLIQIGFEAVDFPVTLKMEYVDANGKKQATSAGIAAGRTTVELEIPEGIRQIDKVYLIWQQPGSITLTSAEVSSTKAEALGIDLALFDPMGEKVSYDKQTYTMTTEEGYAGIQLWLGDANAIESPMLLELKTAGETAKLRVTVGYTDGTEASVDGEGANIQMELDDLRSIQKIMIQNMEAGTVTFNSLNITVRMPNGANAPAWNYIPVSGEGTYTVNGTKVSALTKGLYIMDGKKIVIK